MDLICKHISESPEIFIDKLYGFKDCDELAGDAGIWASKAIFQSLSSVAQAYILRLILIDSPVSGEAINSWVKSDFECTSQALTKPSRLHREALEKLKVLRILVEDMRVEECEGAQRTVPYFSLKENFRDIFRKALCCPREPWEEFNLLEKVRLHTLSQPSIHQLEEYSTRKWNNVLRFLVGLPPDDVDSETRSGKRMRTVLKGPIEAFFHEHGFMANDRNRDTGTRRLCITAKGYEFLLKSRQSQVCTYMFDTIDLDNEEVLSLLFTLCFCELGKGYSISALTENQRAVIATMVPLGLIFMPTALDEETIPELFYPTRTAISLLISDNIGAVGATAGDCKMGGSSSQQHSVQSADVSDFTIVVETNRQVIAHTASDLHIAMLENFMEVRLRMPNMVLCHITRDRAKSAYRMGITAKQICDFLRSHADPLVLDASRTKSAIPDNVTDQLVLWELENKRMKMHPEDGHGDPAVYVDLSVLQDITVAQFRSIVRYLERLGMCLWHGEEMLQIVVSTEGFDQLQSFVTERLGLRL